MHRNLTPTSQMNPSPEPQYEDSGGGVTSSGVVMEENPAYQMTELVDKKPARRESSVQC